MFFFYYGPKGLLLLILVIMFIICRINSFLKPKHNKIELQNITDQICKNKAIISKIDSDKLDPELLSIYRTIKMTPFEYKCQKIEEVMNLQRILDQQK
jgi:hypothetical protein